MNSKSAGSIAASEGLLQAGRKAPVLEPERELELARAAKDGSERAFSELLASHVRLVVAIAREFSSFGLPRDYLLGGLDCTLADTSDVPEGDWVHIGTATVDGAGTAIEGGMVPCLNWLGVALQP